MCMFLLSRSESVRFLIWSRKFYTFNHVYLYVYISMYTHFDLKKNLMKENFEEKGIRHKVIIRKIFVSQDVWILAAVLGLVKFVHEEMKAYR